tara:strand:- start:57 stop:842 length:786 start_codon:yes stop_codon:yes gene_type:complete
MQKKDNALVSVIVNCHNGEQYLEECIKSVINQSYENWELIFWDNCSSDNSKLVLEKFSDKRIKYFRSNKFLNLYNARNLAIEKSKGEYIGFLDTDDFWEKDKIDIQVKFFNKHKDYEIVFSNYYLIKEKQKVRTIKHKLILPSGKITQNLLNFYSIGILTTLVRRNIFKRYKFNKDYNIIGDFDLFITLSQKFKIGSIQEPLASYRVHSSNYSSQNLETHIKELKSWININDQRLRQKGYNVNQQKFFLLKLKIKSFFNIK